MRSLGALAMGAARVAVSVAVVVVVLVVVVVPGGWVAAGPGATVPMGPMGQENLEVQKLRFRKMFWCLGTNGHSIAPKILKTRNSIFFKGLMQQRSTLGA